MGYYAALLLLVLTTASASLGLAWAVPHLLRAFRRRDEAIDDVYVTDRHSWDSHAEDAVLLTHEKRDDEEEDDDEAADDFVLWADELAADRRIRRYGRRMDRWSL